VVVQRRAVRAAEWNYDLNPDIASFLNGMSVRPDRHPLVGGKRDMVRLDG
jgi:hypothetical protein